MSFTRSLAPRRAFGAAAAVAVAASISFLSSPSSAAIAPEDAAHILPLAKVKAGMRGYGLTVFHGNTISRFDVKVIDVMPNMVNGRPLILVKVGGGELNRRNIMIAAGMSGSPVYIGDKLIGAVAYAGDFATEPVGMVTPIEEMLEAWNASLDKPSTGSGEPVQLTRPVKIGSKTVTSIGIGEQPSAASSPGTAWFQPLSTPIFCSGMSQRSMDLLNEKLGERKMRLMPGPGRMTTGAGTAGSQKLVPGGGVGFSLITGDMDMTGIGTVTYMRGDKVLAFGHPMMGFGATEMPMSAAWVHDIYTSLYISYKMASPTAIVGTSFQDRPFSVAGAIGKKASLVPVEVSIREGASGKPKLFRAQVFRHPMFTSMLASMAVDEAIYRQRPYPSDSMARVSLAVSGKNIGTVRRTNVYFTKGLISTAACADLDMLLSLFRSNKFGEVQPESIKAEVELIDTRQTAEIEQIRLDRQTYEPGDTAHASVQVRPYNAEPVTREIAIQIPEDAPDGRAMVMVQGAGASAGLGGALDLGGGSPGMEDLRNAADIRQLLDRFGKLETNNQIVTRLVLPTSSFSIKGEKLTGLPPTMESALAASRSARTRTVRNEITTREDTNWIMSGMDAAPLVIARRQYVIGAKPRPVSSVAAAIADAAASDETPEEAPKPAGSPGAVAMSVSPVAADEDTETLEPEVVEIDASTKGKASSASDEAGSKEKKEEAKAAAPSALPSLGRTSKVWVQSTAADLAKGTMSGVAISTSGLLSLGLESNKLADLTVDHVWSVADVTDGTVYAATGSSGEVYKIGSDGKASVLFKTPGSQAVSVAVDASGRVWAGSSPDGTVWVFENGSARQVAKIDTRHPVGAVALGVGVAVGAGDSGKVWRVGADGTSALLADTGQQHVQALAEDPKGALYAATSGPTGGILWKLDAGKAEPVASVAELYFASVAASPWGPVYAVSGPRGKLYKIEAGKAPVVLVDKLASAASAVTATASAVLLADNNKLRMISPDDTVWEQELADKTTVFALASGGQTAVAGTASGGQLLRVKRAVRGWFESGVQDATREARWGSAEVAAGATAGISLEVRAGDTAEPGKEWSGWSSLSSSQTLVGRYAQMRVELTQPTSGGPPQVSALRLTYLPANQPPTVSWTKPIAGDYVSGKKQLQWSGKDPDGDKLVYDLFISGDNEQWRPLNHGISQASDKDKKAPGSSADKPATATETAKIDTTGMSEADRKFVESVEASLDKKKTESTTTNGTTYDWDTSDSPDGLYWIKVAATDARANGAEALTDEAVLGPVHVSNAEPVVRLYGKAASASAGAALRIVGSGQSKSAPIAEVQYRIGSGDWASAQAVDGLFDQNDEAFVITPLKPKAGKQTVEVRLTDRAGNKAEEKKEYLFTVPEPEQAKAP